MKVMKLAVPAALAGMVLAASGALAQPQTKLTGNLSQATIDAIWCSALFLEETYYWDEGSEEATHYEDMAYDLGEDLDLLMEEAGLPAAESDEIWYIFDEAAADFASGDENAYFDALDACEEAYQANKLKLR